MNIELLSMGVDTAHRPDEVIDRPQGQPYFVLTCFSTPFIGKFKEQPYHGQPGDCILFTPEHPLFLASTPWAKTGFRGDWVHLRGETLRDLAQHYQFPLNHFIPSHEPHLFTDIVATLLKERHHQALLWQEASHSLLNRLLLLMGRAHRQQQKRSCLNPSQRHYLDKFQNLRDTLHLRSHEPWSLDAIAREVDLSVSRMCALYKTFFGISPGEDLLHHRTEKAKEMICGTSASFSHIADSCGFGSIYHFSRMFRRKVGCSPSAYAKANRL